MNALEKAIGSFLIAALSIACGKQSTGAPGSRSSALASSESGDHVQSATGHIEFIGRQGADNWYSFSAIKRIDAETGEETVSGEVEYHSLQADGNFIIAHGDVICLTVAVNVARVGVVADFARNLPNPGPGWAYFTVVDNGEGADAADMGSNLFLTTEAGAQQHCATGHVPAPPIFETQRGNVQVRD